MEIKVNKIKENLSEKTTLNIHTVTEVNIKDYLSQAQRGFLGS